MFLHFYHIIIKKCLKTSFFKYVASVAYSKPLRLERIIIFHKIICYFHLLLM